jgi:hypothetical protein
MSQLSSGFVKASGVDVVGHSIVDDAEGVSKVGWGRRTIGGQQRTEKTVMDLGVENGNTDPIAGEHIGVAVRQASNQAVAPQAAEVIRHL